MWFSAIQKSLLQATTLPWASRPASKSMVRGGLFGERAVSSSRDPLHPHRLPPISVVISAASAAASSWPLRP